MTNVEVLVIGAGPAGIAAATAAAEGGRQTVLLDDNAAPGGQIWRGGFEAGNTKAGGGEDAAKHRALERLTRSGAQVLSGRRVFAAPAPHTLQALREDPKGSSTEAFRYKQLILATGARERFLPFPGWTLPGVFGAGGLQALVKAGFPVEGKRVVVAGTGPLLLAVAAHLRAYGATVVSIVEQAPLMRLAAFAATLWSHPAKIWQGVRYRASVSGAAFHTGSWPLEAIAGETGSLRAMRLTDGKRTWEESCDLLACGFHLVPNTELPALLGCAFAGSFVRVDGEQRTSVPDIFCVGEPTGIAGLEAALIQGEIGGRVCAGRDTATLKTRVAAERTFAAGLEKTFALRPELRALPGAGTIVCRCEDVAMDKLRSRDGWTDAKLQTRCGMGPCQGRICGPAVEFLLGWKPGSVRPPLFPVPLDALCHSEDLLEELA